MPIKSADSKSDADGKGIRSEITLEEMADKLFVSEEYLSESV